MQRHELNDAQWNHIQAVLGQKRGRPSKMGDRRFVNAVLWLAKTGAPWRDLAERFGPWKTVYNRFNNWSKRCRWQAIFEALQLDVDPDGSMADASVIRAHQHSAGGRGGPQLNALGRSRGGLSTKIHALVDTLGKPLQITLTPGQRHEASIAADLIDHAQGEHFIADTAYDADRIRDHIAAKGLEAVIRPHPSRKDPPPYDKHLYKERHLVEIFFNRIKHFRRAATRYDKTARNFLAFVHIACIKEWLFCGRA